ncbi:MAG: hypothetical protein ACO2O0_12140 [Desulfurococcales archaeon]
MSNVRWRKGPMNLRIVTGSPAPKPRRGEENRGYKGERRNQTT